jgi:uncharacterized protein with FMN-binding domain
MSRVAQAALSVMLFLGVASVVAGAASPGGGAAAGATRTREEVFGIIRTVGPTPPDWYDSVPLNYPDTLNLQWEKVKDGWAPDYNMGAWMRTRVWERPDQWRTGIKVLHHAVEVNAGNPKARQESCAALAQCYYFLLLDYARAAYWNDQAGNSNPFLLAECCWRLGSKELASEVLSGIRITPQNAAGAMKVWGEMGEYPRALALGSVVAQGGQPDLANLAAGDAARANGLFDEALKYYRACADLETGGRALNVHKARAAASAAAVRAFQAAAGRPLADGTYSGTSAGGYKGPVTVEVVVRGGRIESVRVTNQVENWYGASIECVPARIVEQQGVQGVDAVTSATTTSRAILDATMTALAAAGQP